MLQHPAMAVATTRTGEASNDEAEHEERGEGAFHPGAGAALRVGALPGCLKWRRPSPVVARNGSEQHGTEDTTAE